MPTVKYISGGTQKQMFAARNEKLTKRIKKALIDNDVTMVELAKRLHITPKTLRQRLSNGTLTLENVFEVESFLHIRLIDKEVA